MSNIVISVGNVGKKYVIGGQEDSGETFREMIVSAAVAPFRRLKRLGGHVSPEEQIWALRDISFDVREGEVLGIVGRNGAGKSTLLKILARITTPTEGKAKIRGRVSSLLEVGTGFHSELTGRENVYLNGAILGMSHAEIDQKFDEIVDFSGVERFLDTPVKRYSSGMSVRLAFAVAAHLEPEILIIDEVLAVGDAEFQSKCLGKMQDASAKNGRTVLFVSHNMTAVASLCSRAILLEGGRIRQLGTVDQVVQCYLSQCAGPGAGRVRTWTHNEVAPGDERVRLRKIEILANGRSDMPIDMATPFEIALEYWNLIENENMFIDLIVRCSDGTVLFDSFSNEDSKKSKQKYSKGLYRSVCEIPGNILNEGRYIVEVHFMHGSMSRYTSILEAAVVLVQGVTSRSNTAYFGRFLGRVHPLLNWSTRPLDLVDQQSSNSLRSSFSL